MVIGRDPFAGTSSAVDWYCVKGRLQTVLITSLLFWPAISVLLVPVVLDATELFRGVPLNYLWASAAVVAAGMWVQVIAVAAILAALGCIGTLLDSCRTNASARVLGLLDSASVLLALVTGLAVSLPGVLSHPVFRAVDSASVGVVTLGLCGFLALLTIARLRRNPAMWQRLATVLYVIALVGLGWTLGGGAPARVTSGAAGANQRIVLGLDSMSLDGDVAGLRALGAVHDGTFYESAVTPGLFTNVVWPAILTGRRPSETGVFYGFQEPDWAQLPTTLVDTAKAKGLYTESRYSDQFTMHVGSDLPFDANMSGPRGWRQPITAAFKDASVFLPVVLPWLPSLPGATTPDNQSGTFAYSLSRELHEVLAGRRPSNGALVLAHIDYLHQPRFPGTADLTPEERRAVWAAPVSGIADWSMDWQYPSPPGAPFDLYAWKVRYLQAALLQAVEETGALDPARKNRLIVFSDHGQRTGVEDDAFGRPEYYRVPLLTFGVLPRNPQEPISLMDIGDLLDLTTGPRLRRRPVVEYANITQDEWRALLGASRPESDGGVSLDPEILRRLGARLIAFDPANSSRPYQPVRTKLAAERRWQDPGMWSWWFNPHGRPPPRAQPQRTKHR